MSNFSRAALWMGLWILCTLCLTLAARELSRELPTFEIMALRTFIGAAVLTPFILRSRGRIFATSRPAVHFLRNTVHFAAQFCWFLAVVLIPLAEVVSIEFTMPIWTAIFASILLGERRTRNRILAIALGFIGVLLILRPGVAAIHPGALAALGSALGFSLSVTLVKKLTGSESTPTILAYMFWTQAVLSAVVLLVLFTFFPTVFTWVWPSSALYPFVVLLGIVGSAGHYCLTRATAAVDATVIGPLDFLRVPLTILMGSALYGEPLTAYLAVGAALILGGNLLNSRKPVT